MLNLKKENPTCHVQTVKNLMWVTHRRKKSDLGHFWLHCERSPRLLSQPSVLIQFVLVTLCWNNKWKTHHLLKERISPCQLSCPSWSLISWRETTELTWFWSQILKIALCAISYNPVRCHAQSMCCEWRSATITSNFSLFKKKNELQSFLCRIVLISWFKLTPKMNHLQMYIQ